LMRPERRRRRVAKGRVAFGGESIPRADHLADVTSECPVSDLFAQVNGDIVFEFYGEIRDTARRIQRAVWEDAVGGAGVDAACACSAVVCDERRVGPCSSGGSARV
jgi:hypothetical protein